MAIVNELGMECLCAVMGSGISTVSLAACHLLQVMFESLTEGMKKDIRGKDEAILPGEFGLRSCLSSNWLEMKVDPSPFFVFLVCVVNFVCNVNNQMCPYDFDTEPTKELRSMLRHLVEMMPAPNVSGPGRDSTINLLIKQVPRKSLKNPDNSLTLWLTDQGM